MADYILNIIIQGDGSGLDPAAASLEHLTTATQATGAAAAGATGQSQGFFSGIFSNLANIGAGIGMLQGFASGVAGVGQSLIAGSAEFEGYEARFASLMGSTDAAKAKIQELSTFASTTPFELPDVIKASQSLQVFGGAALNTKENLAVVGNAAAATGQNIGDVSFWFARAYSAIQNGQPFGEAAQNLQQMGVMSGDTVVKLNALKESGASNQQVWQAFAGSLNAPVDAMTKMGTTWTGLTSTLSDSWSLLIRTFGQPLFDALKPQLQGVIDQLSSGGLIDAVGQLGSAFASVLAPAISFVAGTVIPGVVAAIQFIAPAVTEAISVISQVGSIFMELAGQAMGWGENIVGQLAGGMMNAANAVMSVLQSIGGMIADLLMPGSPPKLLPELDTWGAGAMAAYLEGWGQADFGVFNNIADSIKGALDGIAKASGDKGMNIASIMLGSQDDIAKAINEVHQFGKVSEETFNGLISAIGPAGSEVSGLVSAYLDLQAATQNVASAQQELNSVTDEYAAKLSPLNAQLKGIQNQKQAIQDQKKLAELQAKLADQSLSDADRQMAMLEQQEIMTRQQIRTTEAERDTAVGASKAKLDAAKQEQAAAQARVNQQKALVDAQNKTNALIAEQSKAMAGAAGAMKGAAAAAAPLANAVQGVNHALDLGRQVVGGARDSMDAIGSSFTNVRAIAAPAISFLSENLNVFMGALVGVGTLLAGAAAWGVAGTILTAIGTAIGFVLSPIGLLITAAAALGAAIATNFLGLGTLAQNLMATFSQLGGVIAQAFAAFQTGGFGAGLQTLIAGIGPILAQLGTTIVTWITTQAPIIAAQFLTWGQALIVWIAPSAALALTTLGAWVGGLWAWVQAQAPGWGAQLTAWGAQLAAWIGPAIPAALGALAGFGSSALAWVGAQAGPLLASFSAWAQSLVVWIPGATVSFLAAWPGLLSSFLDWIAGAVGPLLAKLASWALAFTAWIVPMIPSFLVGLGGVALALATWIVSTAAVIATKVVMWAGAILGWIGANVLPALPGMLKGVLESILGWVQSAASSLGSEAASIGRNIVQGIISGVGAAAGALTNKLREMASGALEAAKRALGIASPSQVFAQQVGVQIPAGMAVGITAGMPVVNKNLVDGIAGLSESAVKAITAGSQAIAAASAYHGPGGAGLSGFLAAFADLATRFNDTAVALGGRVLGTATRFADTVGKVIAPIATAVAAFASLADLVVPARTTVGQFGGALALVVGNINVVASWFQQKSVDVGAKFADGAGKMLSIVGPALEAFKKLPDLVVPSRTAVGQFGGALALVVGNIAHVATWFNAQAVTAGAAFAESASKMLALIGSGVDALSKLTTFVSIPQIAVTRFGQALQQSLVVLVAIATTWTQTTIDQAAKFSDGAGKIIGIIGGGVEGFLKLRDFQGVPQTAIDAFGQALNAALGAIEYVSANWIAQFVERAATFAEGAGKAISIIGGAVDGFVKLATFQGVPQGAIDAFGQALNAALTVIEYISAQWIQAFVDRAAVFAEGAGKAVGIIGSAVDGFLKLVAFQGVPEAAFAAFGQALTHALTVIDAMSADWASIGLDRAVAWAGAVDAIVKTITAAVDAIGKLGQLQNGAAGLLDTFSVTLNGILTEMQRQILPATTISGENMVIGLINGILSQRAALVNAMISTVLAAVQAARQTLGIASPSKVFEQIGQYAGQGLQGGLGAMRPAVTQAGVGLGMAAVNGAALQLGRAPRGGTTNNNQRSINVVFEAGAFSGAINPRATADAVATELQRRLGMQGI